MFFARVLHMIFRKMTHFWSVPSVSLRFLLNFLLNSEPVLDRSFCVFAISVVRFCVNFEFRADFRAFAEFRCPFHALSTRSFCVFAISDVSVPSIFTIFDDFRDFC